MFARRLISRLFVRKAIEAVKIQEDGTKFWYRDGKLHREDGPAIERADGSKEWFRNGNRHRENGPAIEYADGTKFWFRDGKPSDGSALKLTGSVLGPM